MLTRIFTALVALNGIVSSTGAVQVFVRLSAGLPWEEQASNRIREVAIHLHDLDENLIEEGYLETSDTESFSELQGKWSLKNFIEDVEHRSGRIFTGIRYPHTNFRDRPVSQGCLAFHVRVVQNSTVVAENCLRTHARWMEKLLKERPSLGTLPLTKLAIPGSHNAGSFKSFHSSDDLDEVYRDCQEEDIYSQLIYGARYLDLRPDVRYREGRDPEFWIAHWVIQTDNRLSDVLRDVKRFLDEHRHEAIVVDFHEFPFLFNHYGELGELVEHHLGTCLFRGNVLNATLAEIIASNRRCVVTFAKDEQLTTRYLRGVEHLWADTDVIATLREFLSARQRMKHLLGRRHLYSAMAELTPQGWGIATDRYGGGVRAMAHRTNLEISSWWLTIPEFREFSNVVSVDFLASSDIVEAAISINEDRARRLERGLPAFHLISD